MDIKAKIMEIVEKAKSDPDFMDKLQENPAKAIESIVGVDLPDDQVNGIVEGVKAKLALDKSSGVLDAAKGLFGKLK